MLYSSSCALAQPLPVRPSIRPVYSPMPARQEYGYYIYIYIYIMLTTTHVRVVWLVGWLIGLRDPASFAI